jgi:pimeloyl-ACP methyl ester carboxylesterase
LLFTDGILHRFFYDRLGIGQSSKPDALSVVQAPLEVEILQSLVTMIKSGYFSNSTFSTVIGTGHSFGSVLTQAVTSKYPTSFNTAILTGFSTNSTGQLIFTTGLNLAVASQNQPYRFTSLSNGYLVSSSAISNQIAFFHAPNFDAAILNLAEATKGTVTFGELFSLGSVIAPASNFTGSVAVVNGAEDLPFCTGNCSYPTNLAQAVFSTLYPDAKTTGAYLAPLTGHGFNLHYSAVAAYHYIQDFISNSTSA